MLIYVGILMEHDCFISICIFYLSSIVLASYLFICIIILAQLRKIIVTRPRTFIWMGWYIRNTLLLLLLLMKHAIVESVFQITQGRFQVCTHSPTFPTPVIAEDIHDNIK